MATRTITRNDLIRQESIQFIREQTLVLSVANARPSTRLYVFFAGENVSGLCGPVGEAPNTPVITNARGEARIAFQVPPRRFHTGAVDVIVTEVDNLDLLEISNNTYGSCRGVFNASGRLDVFQKTSTTIETIFVQPPRRGDPLAQSFFTYGVKGGAFLTSLDLFFNTKDPEVPLRVEIHPLVNGYPSSNSQSNVNAVAVVPAEFVAVSEDASVATRVEFNPPVYLKEDGEFCFVVMANSQKYQMFTSRMGESSYETGRSIYEQPYVGSLFKSENSITWTAEQFEDIKFNLNIAKFDTTKAGKIRWAVDVPYQSVPGDAFSVQAGSNLVTYTHPQDHGLNVGDKFAVIPSAISGSNGIVLYGLYDVTSVPAPNQIVFSVGDDTSAVSTGNLAETDKVQWVEINNPGIGYKADDVVAFSSSSGAGAAAVLRLNADGSIAGIDMTNKGSGYTTPPDVTIFSSTGSGASLSASTVISYSVLVNKPFEGFGLNLGAVVADDCDININLYTTSGTFLGSNLVPYTAGETISVTPNFLYGNTFRNLLIASYVNEAEKLNGSESVVVELEMLTKNANVSPFVKMRDPLSFKALHRRINNQAGETITAANGSTGIGTLTLVNGGSNYTAVPSVVIEPPQLPGGVQATATAVLTGNAVSGFTSIVVGSGYTRTPTVTIVPAAGDSTGAGASAVVELPEFNSELLPRGGNARSRYVTQKTRLDIISNGIRLFATIASQAGASVDWYVRTTLSSSGVDHDSAAWRLIPCAVERNKSANATDFKEYEFRLDNLTDYDTYDLKCVLRAADPTLAPVVKSYRVIALA